MAPQKATFEEYVASCTPFLKIPELEAETRAKVCGIVEKLLGFTPESDPEANLIKFMRQDPDFLRVLLAMTNLSQERFRRVVAAEKHGRGIYLEDWTVNKIHRTVSQDDQYASEIASFFLKGQAHPLLAEMVADFYLDQMHLPSNWAVLIQDEAFAGQIVRQMLQGNYSVQRGKHVERLVHAQLDEATSQKGLTYETGRSTWLAKQIDAAVPNLIDPQVIVMVSYMETTSSSQSSRATEQLEMFQRIASHNVQNRTNIAFVNVIDGGGWLARDSSLMKMYDGCHYCLNINMLDQLDEIVAHHV